MLSMLLLHTSAEVPEDQIHGGAQEMMPRHAMAQDDTLKQSSDFWMERHLY